MAEPRLVATPAAQLHDRHACRALRLWRAGIYRTRALPDVARPRHDHRDPCSSAVTPFQSRNALMTELRTYVSLAADLRAGKTTPRAYLDACLDRIAKLEPNVGAFVTMNVERAK